MARKNGRQHSPDEAGRLEKIWNLSLPLKRKTTSSVTYATANPSSELAVFSCKHKCYRIVNGQENRKIRSHARTASAARASFALLTRISSTASGRSSRV